MIIHEESCEKNPNRIQYEAECQFCGKLFNKGPKSAVFGALKVHEQNCKLNPNKVVYKCKICGKLFNSKIGYSQHLNNCTGETQIKEEHYTNCKFCGKEILNFGSLKAHEKYCNLNPNKAKRKSGSKRKKRRKSLTPVWNKGLTAETDERLKKISIALKQGNASGRIKNTRTLTPEKENERRKKISIALKGNPLARRKKTWIWSW